MMEGLLRDIRFAGRTLAKSPAFAAVAILTLALGIGANTAVFSLVDGVLLAPLPFPDSHELVWVTERSQSGGDNWVTWANFRDWRAESQSFRGLTAYGSWNTTVLGGTEPAWAEAAEVSQDFWTVFGVTPVSGRLTGASEHREGGPPAVVVSQAFVQEFLAGSDPLGRILELRGTRHEIVGVVPSDFRFPGETTLWTPLELEPQGESRTSHNWRAVGRLREGVTAQGAQAELDPLTRRLVASVPDEQYPEYLATGANVRPLREELVGDARGPLLLLLGAAAFVLLVACANLASTLLARGTVRAREMAVRSTLGAVRIRIVRQLLTETAVLALCGAVAGIGLAWAILQGIQAAEGAAIPRLENVGLDGPVLLFTLAVTLVTALAFGLWPSLRAMRDDQARTLRSGGRGEDGYRGRTWSALVAGEVALALVLLVGSGLLIRSLSAVLAEDGGFDAHDVALTTAALSGVKYPELDDHRRVWEEILGQVQALPGVEAAGLISSRPVSGFAPNGAVGLDGDPSKRGDGVYVVASEGVLKALDIPLLRGRLFDPGDGPDAGHVALVSQAFAEAYWPGEDPIGKLVSGGGMDNFWSADPPVFGTVIGVVGDVRFRQLVRAGERAVYWSFRQRPYRIQAGATVMVESASGDPALVAGGLRDAIRQVDPDVVVRPRYLTDLVADSVAQRRFTLLILSGFAAVALLLAAVGIYGVVSYSVAQRTREMGIRLALGAAPASVRAFVMGGAMRPVVLGLAVGLAGALSLGRVISGFLYGVVPSDPATLAGVVGILFVTAWGASWIPIARASRTSPVIAMRAE